MTKLIRYFYNTLTDNISMAEELKYLFVSTKIPFDAQNNETLNGLVFHPLSLVLVLMQSSILANNNCVPLVQTYTYLIHKTGGFGIQTFP
ncbi:hypothetical protein JYT96_02770 [Gammaproteobacteria bacterium AH-315-C21]|nr:hypothetical protein [Gammaproteobacteria bacterium AH-315-C21]